MLPNRRWIPIALLAALAAGCTPRPLSPYRLDAPPSVLVPAALAGVTDGRARFREIFCAIAADHGARLPHDRPCGQALHRLGGEAPASGAPVHLGPARIKLRMLVVPGLVGECHEVTANPFDEARIHVETLGYRTGLLPVSGRSSSAANARSIRDQVLAMTLEPDERLLLIGYSKGSPDVMEALAGHPDLAARVAAFVSLAGVVAGTPLADANEQLYADWAADVDLEGCGKGDGGGVASLTRTYRLNWLAAHRLPAHIRTYSISAFGDEDDISWLLRGSWTAMADIDPRNDSQVTISDSTLPGAKLLGYTRGDHWSVALSWVERRPLGSTLLVTRNRFPRAVLLEAILRQVEEDLIAGKP